MKKEELRTPVYVIDEGQLISNLKTLASVMENTGCRILLAQKAFSCYYEYPLIGQYLCGCTASGLYEARLGHEEMDVPYRHAGKSRENHIYSPAYKEEEFEEIVEICDHIIFNSIAQVEKFGPLCQAKGVSFGLRINPEVSTQEGHEIYDPCAPGSRLGVTIETLDAYVSDKSKGMTQEDLRIMELTEGTSNILTKLLGIRGLHFHTLCEQNSDALKITLDAVEEKFGKYLPGLKWINMGGGHHITREDYDLKTLEDCIRRVRDRYNLKVYLEPGEAVALNAGSLITTVMDIVENGGIKVLILDASAACHMPDVLEMPYRPPLKDSGEPGERRYTYRLSSCTCLAGDVIGDYSFDTEIKIGDRLEFLDMAIYSMVKTNTFNGMALPDISVMNAEGDCEVIKSFSYEDFKCRV